MCQKVELSGRDGRMWDEGSDMKRCHVAFIVLFGGEKSGIWSFARLLMGQAGCVKWKIKKEDSE